MIFDNLKCYDNAVLLSSLEQATVQCAKGLTYKSSVAGYLLDSLCKNSKLREELLSGRYNISPYYEFTIFEPKVREICATRYRDRVWQKSMCNNGLREDLLGPLIYDNGACQKNKGVDFAIDRVIMFLQEYYRKHKSNEGRYDHLDVKGYFPNTPHSVSKDVVDKYVRDEKFREHIHMIIDSFVDKRPEDEIAADAFGERGTALGSEISQLIQLAIPNHIDHTVKEKFGIRAYVRFNDDILIISDSSEQLAEVRKYITDEYAKLGLQITRKQSNAKIGHGIKFLKRRIILTDSGKVIVKPLKERFAKERRTLRKMKAKLDAGEIDMAAIERHYLSTRGGLARCDAKVEVKNLDKFYTELFGVPPKVQNNRRKKKNAYSKSKQSNREKRGKSGKSANGK